MFLPTMTCPEVAAYDPFPRVVVDVRPDPIAVLDSDGRLRIEVDLDDEIELFGGFHLPYLGVLL